MCRAGPEGIPSPSGAGAGGTPWRIPSDPRPVSPRGERCMSSTVVVDRPGPEPALVLASTSTYRRALLERLGVPFRCRASRCDESAIQREQAGTEPRLLAERLALAKAASLRTDEPDAAIIGCDQLV